MNIALLILDINLPRDIDPEVRRVDGIRARRVVGTRAAESTGPATIGLIEVEHRRRAIDEERPCSAVAGLIRWRLRRATTSGTKGGSSGTVSRMTVDSRK